MPRWLPMFGFILYISLYRHGGRVALCMYRTSKPTLSYKLSLQATGFHCWDTRAFCNEGNCSPAPFLFPGNVMWLPRMLMHRPAESGNHSGLFGKSQCLPPHWVRQYNNCANKLLCHDQSREKAAKEKEREMGDDVVWERAGRRILTKLCPELCGCCQYHQVPLVENLVDIPSSESRWFFCTGSRARCDVHYFALGELLR